jgi:hypothetical protein
MRAHTGDNADEMCENPGTESIKTEFITREKGTKRSAEKRLLMPIGMADEHQLARRRNGAQRR